MFFSHFIQIFSYTILSAGIHSPLELVQRYGDIFPILNALSAEFKLFLRAEFSEDKPLFINILLFDIMLLCGIRFCPLNIRTNYARSFCGVSTQRNKVFIPIDITID